MIVNSKSSWRHFSTPSPQEGGGGPENDNDKYISDGEGGDDQSFDSDRRFSNFVLFGGALALGALLMASNVMAVKK